ncbi:hypothetical protein MPSEU_000584200 [Mayamaea pseudoterrestris]|nr:hypothetical protein MPSEU_000584200 [Mayamaea pseudoterrestris]
MTAINMYRLIACFVIASSVCSMPRHDSNVHRIAAVSDSDSGSQSGSISTGTYLDYYNDKNDNYFVPSTATEDEDGDDEDDDNEEEDSTATSEQEDEEEANNEQLPHQSYWWTNHNQVSTTEDDYDGEVAAEEDDDDGSDGDDDLQPSNVADGPSAFDAADYFSGNGGESQANGNQDEKTFAPSNIFDAQGEEADDTFAPTPLKNRGFAGAGFTSDFPSIVPSGAAIFGANGGLEDQSDYPSLMPSMILEDQTPTQRVVSDYPSDLPSFLPSPLQSSSVPSDQPSLQFSVQASNSPSDLPSMQPSSFPSTHPSDLPSLQPSDFPSLQPDSPAPTVVTTSLDSQLIISDLPSSQPSQASISSGATQQPTPSGNVVVRPAAGTDNDAKATAEVDKATAETKGTASEPFTQASIDTSSDAKTFIDSPKAASLLSGGIFVAVAIIAYAAYMFMSKKNDVSKLGLAPTTGSNSLDDNTSEDGDEHTPSSPVAAQGGVRPATTPEQLNYHAANGLPVLDDSVITLVES